ncbi:hypothetical protein IMX07_00810 [bacterium]|nr:hypothetical protein [bacterium]
MAESKTAKEVRNEHLRTLGPTLGPLYDALYNEVVWLHAKWNQYRILYAESPERVELLNRTAGFLFRMIQNVLWEDVLMHIARLTDPPKSAGKDNLSLRRLPKALDELALSAEVATLVEEAEKAALFARGWRNRRLAHMDLKLALEDRAEPLPRVSRHNVEQTLGAMAAILNRIWVHFTHGEIAFGLFIAHDDGESLVYYLESAIDAEDREREKFLGAAGNPKSQK